jgi:hypothetical protein
MSNAINPAAETPDDFEIPVFETPASFPVRSLRGTGPRGLVRDDRLVADADNRRAARAPRKRG